MRRTVSAALACAIILGPIAAEARGGGHGRRTDKTDETSPGAMADRGAAHVSGTPRPVNPSAKPDAFTGAVLSRLD